MRVVFRVDASVKMGTGHVMRCLTMAHALKLEGANVKFICREHKGHMIDKIISSGFHVFKLNMPAQNKVDSKLFYSSWLGVTQKQDAEDCVDILKETRPDWLILDHYGLDEEWQKELGQYRNNLIPEQ